MLNNDLTEAIMLYSVQKPLVLSFFALMLLMGSPCLAADTKEGDAEDMVAFSSADEVALTSEDMDSQRGAAGFANTLTSTQTINSSTTDNTLNVGGNLTNGQITVGDNLGGLGSYVMNTGNNSTINAAVSLNVQIMPPAP
ncbi:MAG TPA: hypothetical protein DCY07_08480 [Rhodospirillaceae bacterium]|nr:hypothetical protein [Rhodospirillaceae bacterium]